MGDLSANRNNTTTNSVVYITSPLQAIAKFKIRSYNTSKDAHLPLLQAQAARNGPGPAVVLIGDSMFERMTTTGSSRNFVAPWPSPTMLDDATFASLQLKKWKRLERVFNAGVGGDKIQNIAYRLAGGQAHHEPGDEDKNLPGLLPLLAEFGSVRLWVVQAGTNNLSAKKGLTDADRDALRALVRALIDVSPREGGQSRALVTGLFYRNDVARQLVDEANAKVAGVVKELNEECGSERVVFLPASGEVKPEEHLVDHVHLSLEGYQLWVKELFPAVEAML